MKIQRSKYYLPFKKDVKLDVPNKAIERMLKGCFIQQQASGIYAWLSLGLRMLEKITKIIEEEHEKVNAVKVMMPTLQPAKLWKDSGRYDMVGQEMLKIYDRDKNEFVYGPSAEEIFTNLLKQWPINKNSFPMILYNVQWKFRDEIRPRYALVRAREFLMKDAYSFNKDKDSLMETYELMFEVYSRIFSKLNLNICTYSSDVGVMGGFLSHEFLVKSEFGETFIDCNEWPPQPIQWKHRDNATLNEKINAGDEQREKYAEIGHIYALGDKYTKNIKLLHPETNAPLEMGCYGIGVSRLITIIFENNEHDLGIAAPFKYNIITLRNDESVMSLGKELFDKLDDVIWDDREGISVGSKFAEADLIGSPVKVIIGEKDLSSGRVTVKKSEVEEYVPVEDLIHHLLAA